MIRIINEWLAKPSGRYSDGLAIFTQLASSDIKKKYLEYFQEVKGEPKQHDIHFTMLINKISAIAQNMQVNPKLYENIELVLKETGPDADTLAAIEEKNAQIEALKEKIEVLKSENGDVLTENSELFDQVEELESDLEDAQGEVSQYEEQLSDLEAELEQLKAKRGLQIVSVGDMPDDIRKIYERNQEITPIMATLHTQISVEGLHHATRKKLVSQLCELDEERRGNWDKMEDWSEGRKTVDFEIEKPAYSVDPLIAGAEMARRILKLQENIKNSQVTLENADREVIKQNAEKRIAAYEVELADLESKIKPAEKEGDVE